MSSTTDHNGHGGLVSLTLRTKALAAVMRRQFEDGLDLILDGAAAQLRATKRARTKASASPV